MLESTATAPDAAESREAAEATVAGRRREGLRFFYPMRILGSLLLMALVLVHGLEFSELDAYHLVLIVLIALHPHLFFFWGRSNDQRRGKIELTAFLFDALYLGMIAHLLGFAPLPTFVLVAVATANALGVKGFRQMLLAVVALLVGVGISMAAIGPNLEPQSSFEINVVCAIFFFLYFHLYAYSAYNRSWLLIRSRRELRQQAATLEIEKRRSDRLLHNLVPSALVPELEREGDLAPRRFDPVVLLAIDFRRFTRALDEHDAAEVLDYLMHCFEAFDAIGTRHGLEKLKTLGDVYLAVRGLPEGRPGDAAACLEAALDIEEFLADLEASKKAYRSFAVEARLAVHAGPVFGGLVRTEKVSYDVWGEAVETVLRMARAAAPGEVLISADARRLADPVGEDLHLEERESLSMRAVADLRLFSARRATP